MAGVHGWFDEDTQGVDEPVETKGDKNPFAEDESAVSAVREAQQAVHAVITKKVQEAMLDAPVPASMVVTKEKVLSAANTISTASTYTGTYTLIPQLYNAAKVNLTGEQYHKLQATEQAFKKLAAAVDLLIPALMGLPTKEYKTVKSQLLLVTEVMQEANKKGLI